MFEFVTKIAASLYQEANVKSAGENGSWQLFRNTDWAESGYDVFKTINVKQNRLQVHGLIHFGVMVCSFSPIYVIWQI